MYRLMDTEAKVRLLTISQETEIERLNAELQSLNCLKEQNIQLDSEVMSRDITISELETCLKQLESEIADLRSQLQAKVKLHLLPLPYSLGQGEAGSAESAISEAQTKEDLEKTGR